MSSIDIQVLETAKNLGLIDEADLSLLKDLLMHSIDLSAGFKGCLASITEYIRAVESEANATPYARYKLGKGPKPRGENGGADWNAKDAYRQLLEKAQQLEALSHQVKDQLAPPYSRPNPFEAARISSLASEILRNIFRRKMHASVLPSRRIAKIDQALCLAWSNKPVFSDGSLPSFVDVVGAYDAARLLSARTAEIAAIDYYRGLGYKVSDVSVGQLTRGEQSWKDFDLLVGDRPVDVKNARRSFSSPDNYVEHCVPAFKTSRKSGQEVSILGVLSNYRSAEQFGSSDECTILGEANSSEMRNLFRALRERFGKIIDFSAMWNPGFQPGWAFEYPVEHYPYRSEAIQKIDTLLAEYQDAQWEAGLVPKWLYTLSNNPEFLEKSNVSDIQRRVIADLHKLRTSTGLTRPSLYLFVMGCILEALSRGEPEGEIERALIRTLFIGWQSTPQFYPLGLDDTQGYIWNLIYNLRQVHAAALNQGIRFKGFKMTHPAILRGERDQVIG